MEFTQENELDVELGCKTSPLTRFHETGPLAWTPEGRKFGYVTHGLPMPAEGSCYVVEKTAPRHVRVIAYVDLFGRAFSCAEPTKVPPARTPDLTFSEYADKNDGTGCIEMNAANGTFRAGEFKAVSSRSYDIVSGSVSMGAPRKGLSYAEAVTTAYLSCHEMPKIAGEPIVACGPETVFDILKRADVFTATRQISRLFEDISGSRFQRPAGLLAYLLGMLKAGGYDEIDPLSLPRRMPKTEQDPAILPSLDVRLARTRSYANLFYLGFDSDAVTPEGRLALLGLESVLNRFLLVGEALDADGRALLATQEECCALDRSLIEGASAQARALFADASAGRKAAPEDSDSEWDVRRWFCEACERMRLPYRFSYRFRVRTDRQAIGVEVSCPPETLMPHLKPADHGDVAPSTEEERNAMQASYARSVAEIALCVAFANSASLDSATVDVIKDVPGRDRILSVRTDRASFESALTAAEKEGGSLVERLERREVFVKNGRLGVVGAFRDLEGEELCPIERHKNPETDERALCDTTGLLHGARKIEDLGINEGAERAKVAESVASVLKLAGNGAAIARLKDIHDRSEDLTLRSVCTKAELAISQNALGEDPSRTIADIFADAWGLRAMRIHASALAEQDSVSARETLEQIVLLSQADGSFDDTESVRHRYFDSYASRVLFAVHDDDPRTVEALPDEIFAAHHGLAQLLHDSFDDQDVALEHAKHCIEIAPTVSAGYLSLARTYFLSGDRSSQIETLVDMLRIAWNPSDAALGLYWLAYAIWHDGRPEVGASCYLQAIKLDPTIQEIAARELDELLKQNPGLAYPGLDGSVGTLLEAGIPIDALQRNAEVLIDAAKIAADSGNLSLASSLLSSGLRSVRDDAMYPLLDSLQQPMR